MSCKAHVSLSKRAGTHPNAVARKLLLLAEKKKSTLVLSADVETTADLLKLADSVGPYIVVLKTHIDIISDFTTSTISELEKLASKHDFLLFEDRKFVDIGNTVQKQYSGGIYQISKWAHIVNAPLLAGPGIIAGLHDVISQEKLNGQSSDRAILILAAMTSAGSLNSEDYVCACVEAAQTWKDSVIGFVAPAVLAPLSAEARKGMDYDDFIIFTTGVNLDDKGDNLGQQYQTPSSAARGGSDFLMVGRGIYAASDPVAMAKRYRDEAWRAYVSCTLSNGKIGERGGTKVGKYGE